MLNKEKGTWLGCAFPDIPSSQGRDPEKARAIMQWEEVARVSREDSVPDQNAKASLN